MSERKIEIQKLKNQPAEDLFLYRYLTIDKLIDVLVNNRIPLTRLNLFSDKLEGTTPAHLILNLTSDKIAKEYASWMGGIFEHITTNFNPTKRNSLRQQRKEFQKYNYASCWFERDHESIAMWQIYSKEDSVALKIPYSILSKELSEGAFEIKSNKTEKISFGKVSYVKFDDLDSLTKLVTDETQQGFYKDLSFDHENEFRIIVSVENKEPQKAISKSMILDEQVDEMNRRIDQKVLYLTFHNFLEFPFEIIFHPQSQPWHRKNIEAILEKYGIKFKVSESRLTRIFN